MEEKNYRGMKVIFLIIFIILGYVIISIMVKNRNFDNDQINGTFTGNASYPGNQIYQINITFNGLGKINGSISNQSDSYTFSGEYVLQIRDSIASLSFSFVAEDSIFVFNCRYADTITGETQMSSVSGITNGTVFLAKI